MKNLNALFVLITTCLFVSCDQTNDDVIIIPDSENPKSEIRNLNTFDKIDVADGIEIVVNKGNTQSVQVFTDEAALPNVSTTVSNGTLTARVTGSVEVDELRIEIHLPSVSEITMDEGSSGTLSGFENLPHLSLNLSNGASFDISGSANTLDAVVSDAASLEGLGFVVSECNATVSSASQMSIFCTSNLSGSVSWVSRLSYKGNPEVNVAVSSFGQLVNLD